jgi:uncharacterized protein
MQKIIAQFAQEIRVRPQQVEAAVQLLDGGATVPFIARYRKEVTDGLDDIQLRELETRLSYLRELRDRKEAVVKAIDEQGKLTPLLPPPSTTPPPSRRWKTFTCRSSSSAAPRASWPRSRAGAAGRCAVSTTPRWCPPRRLALCDSFHRWPPGEDKQPDFSTVQAVLDGVRDLLSERWAENPGLVQDLREWLWQEGLLQVQTDGRQGRKQCRCGQVPRLF